MRGAIAVTAAFVFVGCSIGALEGFSGGGADPDASSPDGTRSADVSVATDGGDAGGSLSCDGGAHLVCATFDQGAVAAGWTATRIESGGTLGTSNDHRSAPFSMRTNLPAMTTEDNQYAAVYGLFTGVRGVRVSFDLKIAEPQWQGTDKALALLHVLYPGTTNESYLFVAPNETTLSIEQNSTATRYQEVKPPPYDEWLRIALEVVPTTPTGTLRLRYDGVVVYENASVPFTTATATETLVEVGLARFTPPSPAVDVLYDNVTIEQIP